MDDRILPLSDRTNGEVLEAAVWTVGLFIRALKPYDVLGDGGTAALSLLFSDRTNGEVLEAVVYTEGLSFIRALKPYDVLGDGGTAALSLIDRTNGAVLEAAV